ncbi:MAG: hypothetical protein PHQ81_08505 [Methanofollis sp.]|nr:hypothetical protein [Methanofollis sp.]
MDKEGRIDNHDEGTVAVDFIVERAGDPGAPRQAELQEERRRRRQVRCGTPIPRR